MSEAKIQIKVGIVEFSGEGDSEWLAKQLDKIIDKVPELLKIELANPSPANNDNSPSGKVTKSTKGGPTNLAIFLKDKNATTNQSKKFLTTAVFLHLNGKNRITTSDVTKALKDNNQGALNNASDNLNQNVKKGHCQKDGKDFYVTPEGYSELAVTVD